MTKNKKIKAIMGVIVFVVAIVLIYFLVSAIDKKNIVDMDEEDDDDGMVKTQVVIDDYIYQLDHPVKSYLFMGTDASGNEEGIGEEYDGSMADFLMLLVIDEKQKRYGFIEINRDTLTEVDMMDKNGFANVAMEMQICTAHFYGGSKKQSCKNTVNAISRFLHGVPIDGYYALPMGQIEHVNHAIGGVEITFDEDMTDIDSAFVQGATVKLSDEQAEKFLRGRMSVQDGENTSRMSRQRTYLNAAFDVVKDKSMQDSKFLASAFSEFEEIATSEIDMNELAKLAQNIAEYESFGILHIDGTKGTNMSLGDGKEHATFLADEKSVVATILEAFPLENTNQVFEDDFDEEDDYYDESDGEEVDEEYDEEDDEEDESAYDDLYDEDMGNDVEFDE